LVNRLNATATWAAGIELASGGLPAQQQWFETSLFDVDSWVVMVKAVDATQWRSDVPAYVLVNVTAPPVENAVQTVDAKTASAHLTGLELTSTVKLTAVITLSRPTQQKTVFSSGISTTTT